MNSAASRPSSRPRTSIWVRSRTSSIPTCRTLGSPFQQERRTKEINATYLLDSSRLCSEFGIQFPPFPERVLQIIRRHPSRCWANSGQLGVLWRSVMLHSCTDAVLLRCRSQVLARLSSLWRCSSSSEIGGSTDVRRTVVARTADDPKRRLRWHQQPFHHRDPASRPPVVHSLGLRELQSSLGVAKVRMRSKSSKRASVQNGCAMP